MDALVRNWTLRMGPPGQNVPRDARPSTEATASTRLLLQSWPGSDRWSPSLGLRISALPSAEWTRDQVMLRRGAGRQEGSEGTSRGKGFLEQSFS